MSSYSPTSLSCINSYSWHLEAYELIYLPSWATQALIPAILKFMSFYSWHHAGYKFPFLQSSRPQAPAPANLNYMNSYSCLPEAYRLQNMPTCQPIQGLLCPTPTILSHKFPLQPPATPVFKLLHLPSLGLQILSCWGLLDPIPAIMRPI